MAQRDEAKKNWIKNFLNGELHQLYSTDKQDLQAHLASQTSDLNRLNRVVQKLMQQ